MVVTKARALAVTQAGGLLLIRRELPGETYWVLPGGGIEAFDVSLEAAVSREVREETGGNLDIHSLPLVCFTPDNQRSQAIFLGRLHAHDCAARSGPEVDDPHGVFALDERPLTVEAIAPLDLWPPAAKLWLLGHLETGTDLFDLPDLRDKTRFRWQPVTPVASAGGYRGIRESP